jgi:molybdopterin/thiamine biosynthesis adenylyltransferase
MERMLAHERAYRSAELILRIASARVVVCGAGAVGSNLAHNLVRMGFGGLLVIDRDRVDPSNLCTQTYRKADVGAQKAVALRNDLFRIAGTEVEVAAEELDERRAARLLAGACVVVDGFDNAASRELVSRTARAIGVPCLHVGLAADYAEVLWDPVWRCPSGRGEDVCDYPMARNLIALATAVASEVLVAHMAGEPGRSYTITLRDLSVQPHPK